MPDFDPNIMGTPNRGTSEASLDTWNRALRASPAYQQFMRRYGLSTDGRVQLSRSQQASLEAELKANGFHIPSGMHIDQGGNLNQKNRLGRNVAIGAGLVGGGLAAAGAAGAGPLAGLFGGGSGAAAAGSGAGFEAGMGLPSGMLPGGAMMSTTFPAAGGAAGTAAGMGAGTIAGGAGTAAGTRALGGAMGRLSAQDLISLGLAGAGTVGGLMSNPPTMAPTTQTTDPNLQKLIASMQGRLDQSEPLYKSIMAMANGLLPTQYQNGGGSGG